MQRGSKKANIPIMAIILFSIGDIEWLKRTEKASGRSEIECPMSGTGLSGI